MKICVVCEDNSSFFYKTNGLSIKKALVKVKQIHSDIKQVWFYTGTVRRGDVESFVGVKEII
jgi:hypothetical protein